jgi:hypothetical protein
VFQKHDCAAGILKHMSALSTYEKLRCSNIERNQKFLDSLDIVKNIIPAKTVIKKKNKQINIETTTNNNRQSKRLRSIDEEPILSNKKVDKISFFNAPVELQEERRSRINSTSLRNYITNNNQIHNGLISENVVVAL